MHVAVHLIATVSTGAAGTSGPGLKNPGFFYLLWRSTPRNMVRSRWDSPIPDCPPNATHAMQGDCAGVEPPRLLAYPQTSLDQCVITAADTAMHVAESLLLSNVYIQLARDALAPEPFGRTLPVITVTTRIGAATSTSGLWMTSSVLRGDLVNCRGVHVGTFQLFHSSSATPPHCPGRNSSFR